MCLSCGKLLTVYLCLHEALHFNESNFMINTVRLTADDLVVGIAFVASMSVRVSRAPSHGFSSTSPKMVAVNAS